MFALKGRSMNLDQCIDMAELMDRVLAMSQEGFRKTVDCHCLVAETPKGTGECSPHLLTLPYGDTPRSLQGQHLSMPLEGDLFVLFLQKCGTASLQDLYLLGRSSECDMTLPHMSVSKQHAIFEDRHGRIFLSDLNSTNGTFVSGHRLEEGRPMLIRNKNVLRFGDVPAIFFSPAGLYSYVSDFRRLQG